MAVFLYSFVFSMAFAVILSPIARHFGWVDSPNHRKQHTGDIPLVGGPGIVLAVTAVMVWQGGWSTSLVVLACASLIVFITGFVDDRYQIRVSVRFAIQILALLGMIWYGDVVLHNFGNLVWEGLLGLGLLAVPITVFSALGVINAFNMIDGLDGLSGSIALIALGGMAFLAGRAGWVEEHAVLLIVFAAVCGFLLMNLRFPWRQRALVFLGDSGTSWLGFVLAWFFIALSQSDPAAGITRAYAPITAVWLFGLPLMDTTFVMIRRVRMGEPIFGADQRHLHHLFIRSGFTVHQTWAAIVGASLLIALIGIYAELREWPEWGRFYAYIALASAYSFWMARSWKYRRFLGRQLS